jgi:hypothetical protein
MVFFTWLFHLDSPSMRHRLLALYDQDRLTESIPSPFACIDVMSRSTTLISPFKRPCTRVKRPTPKQSSSWLPLPCRP